MRPGFDGWIALREYRKAVSASMFAGVLFVANSAALAQLSPSESSDKAQEPVLRWLDSANDQDAPAAMSAAEIATRESHADPAAEIPPQSGDQPASPTPVNDWRKPGGLDKRSVALLIGAITLAFLPVFLHAVSRSTRPSSRRRSSKKNSSRRSRRRSSRSHSTSEDPAPDASAAPPPPNSHPSTDSSASTTPDLTKDSAKRPAADMLKSDKLSPRPRSPQEAPYPISTQPLPQSGPLETTTRLIDSTRATLKMLRNAPETLRQPMIDQVGSLIDALEAEFQRLRHTRSNLPPSRD